jgi:hypothetical protein
MKRAPLRGAKGLRPYARSKPLAASRLALAGYPFGEFDHDSKGTAKIATGKAHCKSKNVAALPAAEAMEHLFSRMDIEGRVPLVMQRAKADQLATRSAESCKLAGNFGEVNAALELPGINPRR